MAESQAEFGSTSDPEGSIFLHENGRVAEIEDPDSVPSLENLKHAFLSFDWERAETILDMIEQLYPDAKRPAYDHLQFALLAERGGVEKNQDDMATLGIVEVRSYLYNLIAERRALGAIALKPAV